MNVIVASDSSTHSAMSALVMSLSYEWLEQKNEVHSHGRPPMAAGQFFEPMASSALIKNCGSI